MSTDWNWYATRELADQLAREGLACPQCGQYSRDIDVIDSPELTGFHCRRCGRNFQVAEYHAAGQQTLATGVTTLYRPVGEAELELIRNADSRRFPPRLFWQPIFYPVLTQDYAELIARDWNSTDAAHCFVGYVTRFQIRNEFLRRYEVQPAAGRDLLEYWIPAEDLEEFNNHLAGPIEVIAEFRHGQFVPTE